MMTEPPPPDSELGQEHQTLKYSLLGPSLTKSGQDNVDQQKVREYRTPIGLVP
jgi:DNA polymerase kappa